MSGNVPDAKEKLIFPDEEGIKQVASDIGCRLHEAAYIDILTLREQRVLEWQHAGLQLSGNIQLLAQMQQFKLFALRFERMFRGSPQPLTKRNHETCRDPWQCHQSIPEYLLGNLQHLRRGRRDYQS